MQRIYLHSFWMALPILFTLLTLPLVGGTNVEARGLDHLLQGKYAYTGTQTCVISSSGFGEDFELLGGASVFSYSTQGIMHFNGDGTGSIYPLHFLAINTQPSPGLIPVADGESNCDLTYSVNPDRSFIQQSTCSGRVIVGNSAGRTYTSIGAERKGQITQGGRILLISKTNAEVSSYTYSDDPTIIYRICNNRGTAIKIQGH